MHPPEIFISFVARVMGKYHSLFAAPVKYCLYTFLKFVFHRDWVCITGIKCSIVRNHSTVDYVTGNMEGKIIDKLTVGPPKKKKKKRTKHRPLGDTVMNNALPTVFPVNTDTLWSLF